MANLYLMRSRSDELNTIISTNLLKNYSKIYKNIAIYCPVNSFFRIYTITGLFIKFGKESIYQLITGYYPFFYVLFSLLFSLVLAFGSFCFFAKLYAFFFSYHS